jgi:hypothetical protein
MKQRQRGSGSLYKQPGSNVWWMSYYRNGRQLRESTGTTDEANAGKILKKRVAQVTTGTHPGLAIERVRVDELAMDFLTDYKVNGHKSLDDAEAPWRLHLAPAFSGMKAAHVTTAKLRQYVDERQTEGAATATINRELAALRRMFYLGHQSTPRKSSTFRTSPCCARTTHAPASSRTVNTRSSSKPPSYGSAPWWNADPPLAGATRS